MHSTKKSANKKLCLPILNSNYLAYDIFSFLPCIKALTSMRSLSKQNLEKSNELYRFLEDYVDLNPRNEATFAQKKKFLQNT